MAYSRKSKKGITTYYISYHLGGIRKDQAVGKSTEGMTLSMAKKLEAKRRSDILAGDISTQFDINMKKNQVTMDDVFAPFLTYSALHKKSYGIDVRAAKKLKEFFKTPDDLNTFAVDRYKKFRLSQVKHRSVDVELCFLKSAVRKSQKCGILPINHPIEIKLFLKDNKRSDYLSAEERTKLFEAVEGFSHTAVFLVISLLTGFRKSEVLSMRYSNIDLGRNNRILLEKTKTTATPTTYNLNAELKEYIFSLKTHYQQIKLELENEKVQLEKQGKTQRVEKRLSAINRRLRVINSDYIVTEDGSMLLDIKRSWRTLFKHANIEYKSPHITRHTYATMARESGMSLEDLLDTGLWKDYQSVRRYAHIGQKELKAKMDKISILPKEEEGGIVQFEKGGVKSA